MSPTIVLLFQIQLQNIVGKCFAYKLMQVLDICSITVEAAELICCRCILFAIAFVVNPTPDPTICEKCVVITAACWTISSSRTNSPTEMSLLITPISNCFSTAQLIPSKVFSMTPCLWISHNLWVFLAMSFHIIID